MSTTRRLTAVATAALALLVATAAPAVAHVTVNPSEAEQGGFAKLTFRVPNERDDAGTTKVEVFFPEETPLFSVSTKPVPGWTATVERTELDEPVEVFGEPRTDAVAKITWEGSVVNPGEFQEFDVSAGPLPEADQMVFQAIQTYSSGEVVRWIEEPTGGEEPEHPAPVLTLVPAADEDGDTATTTTAADDGDGSAAGEDDDDDASDAAVPLAIAASFLSVVAAIFGFMAFSRSRRA